MTTILAFVGKMLADAFGRIIVDLVEGWRRSKADQALGAANERQRANTAAEQQEADAIGAGNRDEPIKYRD